MVVPYLHYLSNFRLPGRIPVSDHILVIDDDDALRLLYEHDLGRSGYLVDTASCASEAVERFSEGNYDLAIVDIEMPGTDGLELLGQLREMSPHTRLVINSAYSSYKADFNSWLADGYIVKSSDLEPLKSKIKELLVKSDRRK
ncbi:MAG: response regulator [Candidatus Zixiibacteriota bacterium]|nr:MAG: response regulator [candidate division Zixibacteria bacterium]